MAHTLNLKLIDFNEAMGTDGGEAFFEIEVHDEQDRLLMLIVIDPENDSRYGNVKMFPRDAWNDTILPGICNGSHLASKIVSHLWDQLYAYTTESEDEMASIATLFEQVDQLEFSVS